MTFLSKVKNLETKIPLLILGIITLVLYLPTLNRPYHFEEIKVTKSFHTPPPANISVFSQETLEGSRWDSLWKEYIRIQPPGLLYFYRAISSITQENEILMRLPLFILVLLCLYKVFHFTSALTDPTEGALITLFLSCGTWWYGLGSLLYPESFALLFSFLSCCLYFESLKNLSFKKALTLVNFLGLSVSYFFIPLVLLQALFSFLSKETRGRKSFIICSFLLSFLCAGLLGYAYNPNFSNPLTQHWGKVEQRDTLRLFELSLLGSVRE